MFYLDQILKLEVRGARVQLGAIIGNIVWSRKVRQEGKQARNMYIKGKATVRDNEG